mmetsp:Transcript_49718/g.125227  ORF Transcript_49718/g.125227 Transcript_49718/m.125227 type:complete len:376 (-) Transcript_49718:288-1415(-)
MRDFDSRSAKIEASSHADNGETDSETNGNDDDFEALECEWPNVELEEDIFGLSICSLTRDFWLLATKKGDPVNRYSRVLTSFTLLFGCLAIQIFLLSQVKRFVSAKAVHDVRIAYDKFENIMYDGHTTIFAEKPTLERRGIGGEFGQFFNKTNFYKLSDEDQASACRIPLSQPLFFWVVLFVWSLVCMREIRVTKELFQGLITNTQTCDSMQNALEDEDGIEGGAFVIARLTVGMKIALTFLVILPRFGITAYLLWLGCRWLLATNNFADLILNSVALEFILCLKDVLYLAMVPRRSQLDLADTTIKPPQPKEPESLAAFTGTVSWGLVAAAWVTCYMGFRGFGWHVNGWQQVLREYQWDVHNVCTQWVLERYAV